MTIQDFLTIIGTLVTIFSAGCGVGYYFGSRDSQKK